MKITPGQVRLLRTAQRKLGMSDDDYRALLDREAGVTSTKDLRRDDVQAVLARFQALGFEQTARGGRKRKRGKDHGWRRDMASPEQVRMIRDLWFEFTDGEGDDRSLGKWLERTFKVSDVKFVGYRQGQKVITALISMNRRKQAKDRAA
ncbi:MAG: regulatory protein GemA [Rhodobacteraceae bacterium]|nr:regulatory protein GemA [Paracoccaceae bacterium]